MMGQSGPVIPVVRLHGVIAAEQRPGRLNIESVAPLLKRAFANKAAPAVAIIVNSPGGSPVQSRLIAKRIRDLADENDKPVLVFVEDAAASGGYFIATAGDEIIADPSSIVGSIGVIFAGFGFVGALDKLGVERRVHTSGRNKSTLDPFLPEKAEDVERIKTLETDIHHVFIDLGEIAPGRQVQGADEQRCSPVSSGVACAGSSSASSMGSGISARPCASASATRSRCRSLRPGAGFFTLPRIGLAADIAAAVEDRAHWTRLGL
ncbi:MAG: S49 family peptidase [Mycobacterium sp.]|nr:S49 family peptidase [Mycobacterium sp.]